MDATVKRHLEHKAQLATLGEHWHQKLWYGSGPWDGDQFLNLYHHVLTDQIELWYEVPNQKPELVAKIPLDDFDIDKLCTSLATADNRKKSVTEKIDEIDAHNEALQAEQAKVAAEQREAFEDRMRWAVRKDSGNHVSPIVLP